MLTIDSNNCFQEPKYMHIIECFDIRLFTKTLEENVCAHAYIQQANDNLILNQSPYIKRHINIAYV